MRDPRLMCMTVMSLSIGSVVYTYDGMFRIDAFCEGVRYRISAFIQRWRRSRLRLGQLL